MARQKTFISRLLFVPLVVCIVAAAVYGLSWVNERMTIRYQAVGKVVDSTGSPIPHVEAVLLLESPPPSGPLLDQLFLHEGLTHDRRSTNGQLKRTIGPTIGLSDYNGIFIVRAVGRVGTSHAIRLGLDTKGRPPYERAWIVLRREGMADYTKVVSILGWKTAPGEWGNFVNRLPRIVWEE